MRLLLKIRIALHKRSRRRNRVVCDHAFDMDDLYATGIPLPVPPPVGSGYQEFSKWIKACEHSPARRKRVACPCWKCGRIFYADYGLNITNSWTEKPKTS